MCNPGLAVLLLPVMAAASTSDTEATWPCFHGSKRDNRSTAKDLLQRWPHGGPRLLWTAAGIGHGYSSVAVTADRLVTAGMIEKKTYVIALDMKGKMLWKTLNGHSWEASQQQPWAVPYSGSLPQKKSPD